MQLLCTPATSIALLITCAAGCSSGPATGDVKGVITLQGRPISGAELLFASTTDENERYIGVSNAQGAYQVSYRGLSGLPVGQYKAAITVLLLPSGVPFPPGERAEVLKSEGKLVTTTYVFEKEIVAGSNAIDFELSQGQKQK